MCRRGSGSVSARWRMHAGLSTLAVQEAYMSVETWITRWTERVRALLQSLELTLQPVPVPVRVRSERDSERDGSRLRSGD